MKLPAPQTENNDGWIQILVLFASVLVLLLLLVAGRGTTVVPSMADKTARVYFVEPQDGATVPQTFTVQMAAEGIAVAPAGEIAAGSGHFHILIDQELVAPGTIIPIDTEGYLHFGQAQTETELTLEPGTYTLHLQFADGAHQAYAGLSDTITITVE